MNRFVEFAKKLPGPVSTIAVVLSEALELFGKSVTVSGLVGVSLGLLMSGVLLWKGYYPFAGSLFIPVHEYNNAIGQVNAQALQITDLTNEVRNRSSDAVGEATPIPIVPSGDVIIDGQGIVNFSWKDSRKDWSAYTIVVRQRLGNGNQEPAVRDIEFDKVGGDFAWPVSFVKEGLPFGEYVWTVKRRTLNPDASLDDSDPDNAIYRRFSVYPSVLSKIRTLHSLVVGTSLIPDKLFFSRDGTGKASGYEPELVGLITERLRSPNEEVAVNFRYLSWADLLPKLSRHEIDVVVSSMTKTKTREDAENVRFSSGYYTTHERFVAHRNTERCLVGMRVGVLTGQPKTTNEIAANLLEPRYRFVNVKGFPTTIDLFKALESGDVDVILVDDISAQRYYKADDPVEFFGPNLDETLTGLGFYNNIGFPKEEFGIAVSRESSDLLSLINGLLEDARKNGTLKRLSDGLIRGGLTQISSHPLC